MTPIGRARFTIEAWEQHFRDIDDTGELTNDQIRAMAEAAVDDQVSEELDYV